MFGNLLILRLRVDTGLVLLEMVARWYRQLFKNVFSFFIDGLTMWIGFDLMCHVIEVPRKALASLWMTAT